MCIGINVYALNIEGSIELSSKSSTIILNNDGIKGLSIKPDLEFNEVGDYITYKIILKNIDNTDYQVLSVSDNNTNQYIKFSYSFNNELNKNDKEILLTIKYDKECENDLSLKDVKTIIKLTDNTEEKEVVIDSNPKTNDSITKYAILLIVSLVVLFILINNKKTNKVFKVFIIALLLVPSIIYAAKEVNVSLSISSAKIKVNRKFDVTFDTDGAESIDSQTIRKGGTVTKPANPTKANFEFVRWVNKTEEYDFSTPVTGNVELTAEWIPTVYTITYNLDGGINNSNNPSTYTVETNDFTIEAPTKAGYAFKGWTGSNGTTKEMIVTVEKGTVGALTYNANWNEIYTVTFNIGIESVNRETRTRENAEEIGTLPIITEPTGYDFIGWYVENTQIDETYVVTSNIVVEAKYVKEEYTVTFKDGDAVLNTLTVEYNETVVQPTDLTKEDYIFKGWKDSSDNYYDFSTPVIGNMILSADWQVGVAKISDWEDFSSKVKSLASDTIVTDPYAKENDTTTAFIKASVEQFNTVKNSLTSDNVFSNSSSTAKAYMWYDSTTTTLYWYSVSDKIYVIGSFEKVFAKMSKLSNISGLAYFDTSEVTDMNRLFQGCSSLSNVSAISGWDTSKVTSMRWLFGGAQEGQAPQIEDFSYISGWNVSNVLDFNQAFKWNKVLTDLDDFKDWNMSGAEDISQMFNNCKGLTDMTGIKDWEVYNVTTFNKMFSNVPGISSTNLPNFTKRAGSWNYSTGTYNPS